MAKSNDETARVIEILRERISKLTRASLRLNASLDLGTVLREVVENARDLTGAKFGGITTIDREGAVEDFVTSGITADEHRQLVEWQDGPRLFAHFRDLSGPLRVADFSAFVHSLGFSAEFSYGSFQGTPMHHRGVHVGNFYLAKKEGDAEFTGDDEEVLMLFASQAATAIANARMHREEQQARADLEALIETCPWASGSSPRRPTSSCRSIARRSGSWTRCEPRTSLSMSSWGRSPAGSRTGGSSTSTRSRSARSWRGRSRSAPKKS